RNTCINIAKANTSESACGESHGKDELPLHRDELFLFRAVVIFFIWFGAVGSLPLVFSLADTGAGTMVILNIWAIVPLSGVAIKLLKNFNQQRRQGIDPVFHRDMLPEIKNIEVWDGSDPATRRSLDDLKAKQ